MEMYFTEKWRRRSESSLYGSYQDSIIGFSDFQNWYQTLSPDKCEVNRDFEY